MADTLHLAEIITSKKHGNIKHEAFHLSIFHALPSSVPLSLLHGCSARMRTALRAYDPPALSPTIRYPYTIVFIAMDSLSILPSHVACAAGRQSVYLYVICQKE